VDGRIPAGQRAQALLIFSAMPASIPSEMASPISAPAGITLQKISVEELKVRDRVILLTAKGTYFLTVGKKGHAILSSTNSTAQAGQIILKGGTNADVTEYTPNRIVLGGRLAYAFDEETLELITTPVIDSLAYERSPN
jgi:hypothetical protein